MKIEAAEAAERAWLAAIARVERARLARLAELEQQRVAWLEGKLAGQAGAEALRRLVARPAGGAGEGPAWQTMRAWAEVRLAAAEARLAPAAIAAELPAFAEQG